MAVIMLKSLFSGWRPATKEQAKRFVNHLYHHGGGHGLMKHIQDRVRGIDIKELIERRKYASRNKRI